jgi:hypothetical protein
MLLKRTAAKKAYKELHEKLAVSGTSGEYEAFSYGAGYLNAIRDKITKEEYSYIWDQMCNWSGLEINH